MSGNASDFWAFELDKNARKRAPHLGFGFDFERAKSTVKLCYALPKEDVLGREENVLEYANKHKLDPVTAKKKLLAEWPWPCVWAFRIEIVHERSHVEYFVKAGYKSMKELNGLDPKKFQAVDIKDSSVFRDYLRYHASLAVCEIEDVTGDNIEIVPMHSLAKKKNGEKADNEHAADITTPTPIKGPGQS